MENLTGGTPPVRYLPCVVPCKLYFDNGETTLLEKEISSLLEDPRIAMETALALINASEEAISIEEKSYPLPIKVKIIETHLDPNEVPLLLQSFDRDASQIRTAVLQYAKKHTDFIVSSATSIRYIPTEVYATCLDVFTESQAKVLRAYLPNKDFEIACSTIRKPKFPDTPETRIILNYFRDRHWISSYKIQDGIVRVYPTQK